MHGWCTRVLYTGGVIALQTKSLLQLMKQQTLSSMLVLESTELTADERRCLAHLNSLAGLDN